MIISKTPFRFGLFGGGTDLPSYANHFGGAVLNLTVNRYVYVTVHDRFEKGIRLSYSQTEIVLNRVELIHPIVRNSLDLLKLDDSLEITSISEIPSHGSGLGSSSSFTVGLLKTLNAHSGKNLDAITLAEQACHVEIGMCGQSIGKQDQYAAAIGGINLFQFNTNDSVTIEPVVLSQAEVEYLFSHFLVFYTGETRSATEMLNQQQNNLLSDNSVLSEFHKTKEFAFLGTELLRSLNVKALGELMNLAWRSKKKFSTNVSNAIVDVNYENALLQGAFGGKLLGAGGGGFFLYLAPVESHQQIIDSQVGYKHISIGYEPKGSQVIFQN